MRGASELNVVALIGSWTCWFIVLVQSVTAAFQCDFDGAEPYIHVWSFLMHSTTLVLFLRWFPVRQLRRVDPPMLVVRERPPPSAVFPQGHLLTASGFAVLAWTCGPGYRGCGWMCVGARNS